MQKDKVYIIGVSPDGASSLSPGARRLVRRAGMLFGGERLLEMFPSSAAQKIAIADNLGEIADLIKANAGRKRVVVLATGDPNFFGVAGFLNRALGKDAIEIIPGVSTMQLAFARIKESWDDAVFISVHARPLEGIADAVRSHGKVCILTDSKNNPGKIAQELCRNGLSDCRVYVCQDLGSDKEEIVQTDLYHVTGKRFSALNIMILIRDNPAQAQPAPAGQLLGIPESRFRLRTPEKSLITKLEVRAVSLAKLCLTEDSILWDIGAGSGAVSIEAASLARRGKIFAVEKNSADIAAIRENVRRFGRRNIEIVQATAPDRLEGLPAPTAVFIGGSGGQMPAILQMVCQRLKAGGRIVANVATLESLQTVCRELGNNGFAFDVTLLNVARSTAVQDLTRLEALNPVFIVAGWRQGERTSKRE